MDKKDILAIVMLAFVAMVLWWPALSTPTSIVAFDDVTSAFYPIRMMSSSGAGWNPFVSSGSPLTADPLTAAFYPVDALLFSLFPAHYAFSIGFWFHTFLAGLFTFLCLRYFGIGKEGGMLAGITFMLSSFVVAHSYAGHYSMISTVAWMPAVLLGVVWALDKRTFASMLIAALPLCMQLLAGHQQVVLYTVILAGLYALAHAIKEAWTKRSIMPAFAPAYIFAGIVIVGVLLAAVQFVPTLELSRHVTRSGGISYDFATTYSLPWHNLATIVAPDTFGNPVDGNYINEGSYWELALYVGILPLVLALLAFLFMRKDWRVAFFVIVGVIGLALALGKHNPVYWLLWKFIPGFNLFRVPARFGLIWTFAIAVLAGFGLDRLLAPLKEKQQSVLRYCVMACCVGAIIVVLSALAILVFKTQLLAAAFPLVANGYASRGLFEPVDLCGRVEGLIMTVANDLWYAAFFLLLSASVLLWKVLRKKGVATLAILLVIVNLLFYGTSFIVTTPLSDAYAIPAHIAFLQEQPGIWRVYDADGAIPDNYQIVWNVQAVQGYNPLLLKNYVSFIKDINVSERVSPELNLLNARFVASTVPLHNPDLTLLHNSTAYVYGNAAALPRAFLVSALTDTIPTVKDVKGQHITSYTYDTVTIQTDSEAGGVLVLGDISYPGWIARIDGKETPVLTAYDGVRAVTVGAGKHAVVFSFEPRSVSVGLWISMTILLVILVIVTFIYHPP